MFVITIVMETDTNKFQYVEQSELKLTALPVRAVFLCRFAPSDILFFHPKTIWWGQLL